MKHLLNLIPSKKTTETSTILETSTCLSANSEEFLSIKHKNNELVKSIYHILKYIIEQNKKKNNYYIKVKKQSNQIYSYKSKPIFPLEDYIDRIYKYDKMEDSTLILSLIYIDKLCNKMKIVLTEYNIHNLLLIAIDIAIKYNEDKFFSNSFYAKVGGVNLVTFNQMETQFLIDINFSLFTDKKLYEKYEMELSKNPI